MLIFGDFALRLEPAPAVRAWSAFALTAFFFAGLLALARRRVIGVMPIITHIVRHILAQPQQLFLRRFPLRTDIALDSLPLFNLPQN